MEQVHRSNKASKFASQDDDVINRMPENVITHILDRLPIRGGMRTSILSRNWRFNWTMLTQLIFDEDFIGCLRIRKNYDWRIIISTLFINIKGPITKFILNIPDDMELGVEDINHWVMFLSRNGIKDFTLFNCHETPLKLPTHLFFCLELKHLTLECCCLCPPPPTFYGFPNLLSLYLSEVADLENCIEIFTKCPLLDILRIIDNQSIGKVKLAEIAILKNLKVLSLPLHILDNVTNIRFAIFQLGCYLPKLQDLSLNFLGCKFIEDGGVRKWGCTAFPCLKNLHLYNMDLSSNMMISFAFEMIWGSLSLQTLYIRVPYDGIGVPPLAFCFPEVDNNTKLHLQSVDFNWFTGSENEVYMIKTLLACSPFLHRMNIRTKSSQVFRDDSRKLMLALKLLELNQASTIAKVKLYQF